MKSAYLIGSFTIFLLLSPVIVLAESHQDHSSSFYTPLIISIAANNIALAPTITCTTLENGTFEPLQHSCKLAKTLFIDDDWADKQKIYLYLFEDWTDYDYNDIMVSLRVTLTYNTIKTEIRLLDREAAWKNPLNIEITPDFPIDINWISTDYPSPHLILSQGEIIDINLFSESNINDTASLTINPPQPPHNSSEPVGGLAAPITLEKTSPPTQFIEWFLAFSLTTSLALVVWKKKKLSH